MVLTMRPPTGISRSAHETTRAAGRMPCWAARQAGTVSRSTCSESDCGIEKFSFSKPRTLVRAREDAVGLSTQAKHRLKAFLLRQGRRYPGMRPSAKPDQEPQVRQRVRMMGRLVSRKHGS
jgi:hypothetical protein